MLTAAGLCAAAVFSSSLSAALIAYEAFDYAPGSSLVGQAGGTGFSTAWGSSGGLGTIEVPGLGWPDLTTTGNKLYVAGNSTGSLSIFRTLATPQGADGTTVWISFLGQDTTALSANFGPDGAPSRVRPINMSLYQDGSERLALGEGTRTSGISLPDTDVWGLVERGGVNNAGTRWTTAPLDTLSFVLVRIDFGTSDMDTAYMWINPSLTAEPDISTAMATTTYANMNFNRIRPFAGNPTSASGNVPATGFFDEIRIGETFGDVTPIPEPATALVGLLGLGVFCLRRRSAQR